MKLELHNADCMDIMAKYDDNYFDLAIVDPPYRDAKDNDMNKQTRKHIKKGRLNNWEDRPSQLYFSELIRVSSDQIIWGANNFQLPQFKGFVVWRKPSVPEKFTMSMCEIASLSDGLGTISKIVDAVNGEKKIHPTQKPVELYKWLYANYAKPNMKILDTHLGSGSNTIAAYEMDMGEFVGCELDKDYFDAASKRINNALSQQKLF